jgi:hypothetical protein
MKIVFIELPAFERHRAKYLNDDEFQGLQRLLMLHPEAGQLDSRYRRTAQTAIRRCTAWQG